MLKMTQGEQRGTYLADHTGGAGAKVKADDMAGQVAAPNASPFAAVFLSLFPRVKKASGIVSDALLECEQGLPLAGVADGSSYSHAIGAVVARHQCKGRW
jgi:hypothetical protein